MKLSDVKGERTFDVIAEIIEPIANIAQDEEAKQIFTPKPCPDGMKPTEFMLARIKKSAPKLLKNHKSDLVTIISSIKGIEPSAYLEELNLALLVSDMVELVTDEEFVAFLS